MALWWLALFVATVVVVVTYYDHVEYIIAVRPHDPATLQVIRKELLWAIPQVLAIVSAAMWLLHDNNKQERSAVVPAAAPQASAKAVVAPAEVKSCRAPPVVCSTHIAHMHGGTINNTCDRRQRPVILDDDLTVLLSNIK